MQSYARFLEAKCLGSQQDFLLSWVAQNCAARFTWVHHTVMPWLDCSVSTTHKCPTAPPQPGVVQSNKIKKRSKRRRERERERASKTKESESNAKTNYFSMETFMEVFMAVNLSVWPDKHTCRKTGLPFVFGVIPAVVKHTQATPRSLWRQWEGCGRSLDGRTPWRAFLIDSGFQVRHYHLQNWQRHMDRGWGGTVFVAGFASIMLRLFDIYTALPVLGLR